MKKLENKNAVVTGGNSGIGFAVAKQLKEQGANVIIVGRNQEKVAKAAEELGVKGLVADVSKTTNLERLKKDIEPIFTSIDILFVNAGVFFPTPLGSISEEVFDTHMDINFKGAVFTLEKLLPLLNDGASVINLSSVNAYTGMPNTAIYAASKAAMNSFTRTAAIELAPKKIRVNAVNPGPVSTPIFEKTGMEKEQLEGFAQNMQERVPLKRFGHQKILQNW